MLTTILTKLKEKDIEVYWDLLDDFIISLDMTNDIPTIVTFIETRYNKEFIDSTLKKYEDTLNTIKNN